MTFETTCKINFSGLIEKYNLHVEFDVKKARRKIVYLKNKTTGIEVIYESTEDAVFVRVSKLLNGQFPTYGTLHQSDADILNRFYVDDLILLRAPELRVSPFIWESSINKVLYGYSTALEKCAGDVLSGDFSVFTALSEIVKKRIVIDDK